MQEATWTDATESKYVRLEENVKKMMVLTNYRLSRVRKFDEDRIEFQAQVVNEDGEACDKIFSTVSAPLMRELRPFFDEKNPGNAIELIILKKKVGTNKYAYLVEEVRA